MVNNEVGKYSEKFSIGGLYLLTLCTYFEPLQINKNKTMQMSRQEKEINYYFIE